jgi:hypothetical protein
LDINPKLLNKNYLKNLKKFKKYISLQEVFLIQIVKENNENDKEKKITYVKNNLKRWLI